MNLSRAQCIAAVSAIDTITDAKNGYTLDHKVRYKLHRNFDFLIPVAKAVETTKMDLIAEIAPESKEIKPNTPQMTLFATKWREFMETEESFDKMFCVALYKDLRFDINAITPAVLADLGPILLDEEPAQ
jgi:hypothetical protein